MRWPHKYDQNSMDPEVNMAALENQAFIMHVHDFENYLTN